MEVDEAAANAAQLTASTSVAATPLTVHTATTSSSSSSSSTPSSQGRKRKKSSSSSNPPADGAASSSSSSSALPPPSKRQHTRNTTVAALPTPSPPPPVEYLIRDGLRYVRPYEFTMQFNVKKRWYGSLLLDMLQCEYKNPLPNYYSSLLDSECIRVQPARSFSKPITEPGALRTHKILSNDQVSIMMHRHEPPVLSREIQIIHYAPIKGATSDTTTDTSPASFSSTSPSTPPTAAVSFHSSQTIVVNKPAGMPVHASGRYLHNSVVGILKSVHRIEAFRELMRTVHRLDRVTSGLLLLSLTRSNCVSLTHEFSNRLVTKQYVARVRGVFPDGEKIVEGVMELGEEGGRDGRKGSKARAHAAAESSTASIAASTAASSPTSSQPIAASSSSSTTLLLPSNPFMSAHVPARMRIISESTAEERKESNDATASFSSASVNSKSSSTSFTRLSTDGVTSLLLCRPLTGRTHQIRLHLSTLGFPIANDYVYGGVLTAGNTYHDESAKVMEEERMWKEGCMECEVMKKEIVQNSSAMDLSSCAAASSFTDGSSPSITPAASLSASPSSSTLPPSSLSTHPQAIYCSSIWLHCSHYSGPDWSYTAPLPDWAQEGFDSAAVLAKQVHQQVKEAEEQEKE